MYIYQQVFKHNYTKDAHAHTVQTDRSEGQCGLTEITLFIRKKHNMQIIMVILFIKMQNNTL